jgi:hypothetical protein
MFDEDRANKLEELADLARESGDHSTELAALEEMAKMKKELQAAIKRPQEQPKQEIGFGEGLVIGGERGVKQVLGGAGQKLTQWRQGQLNSQIDDLTNRMQSGEIPATKENIARLDQLQAEAIKFAQLLTQTEEKEKQDRAEFSKVQDSAPVSSTIGNIAGQMVAIPSPASPLKWAPQIAKGIIEGGALGYIQPTVDDESAASNAKTGAAIGGAVPLALRPITTAAGGAYRALTGSATGDAASAVKFAKEKDIPLLTSDVAPPKTFAGKGVQTIGEKVPLIGTGGRRAAQQDARTGAVEDIAKRYGEPDDQEIYNSLIRKSDTISKAAGKRYEEIASGMGGVVVPINKTVSTIDAQIAALNRAGAIRNENLTKILDKTKADLTAGPQDITLLRGNRTRFREEIKGKDVVTTTTEQRIIDSVYRSMTDDIDAAVRANLGDVKADSLKQVDKIWAKEANELKKTKLKNIFEKGDVRPADASKMLFTGSPDEIKILYRSLDGEGRKKARAALIHKASDEGTPPPEVFVNNMRRYQKQHNAFFRGKEGDELRGLLNYLNHTRQASRSATLTTTGQQMIPAAAVAGVGTDYVTTGGVGTALTAGTAALSSAYESPIVRDLMLKMSAVEKGSTALEKLAAKLEAQLNMIATRVQGEQE